MDFRVHVVAGGAAGIMEHCIMYPVDSIKTRMQCLLPHADAVYKNIPDAFYKIYKHEGILRTLRGVDIVFLGAGPAHAMYFSTYELSKRLLGNTGGGHFPVANALAGMTATLFHDAFMNPVEVVKQRLQMYNSPYGSVLQCARHIYASEGLRAFYRSFTTQLSMNLPFQTFHFVTYEFMRETLNPAGGYSPAVHLISGATAGCVAASLTTPLDVAKTLLNTQEERAVCCLELGGSANNCIDGTRMRTNRVFLTGMLSALKSVYQLRGMRGYVQGLSARVLYQMPSCAISWSVYEFFKHQLSLQISDEEMIDLTM